MNIYKALWIGLAVTTATAAGAQINGGGFTTCDLTPGGRPVALTATDLDRDGDVDLAVVDQEARVVILRNNPVTIVSDCRAGLTQSIVNVVANALAIAAGDIDSNGTIDLVIAAETGIQILRGNGNGEFTPEGVLNAGASPQSVAIGDVNGDAAADIVAGNGFGTTVTVLTGPVFDPTKRISFDLGSPAIAIEVRDLNDDTFDDIVALMVSGQVGVLLQDDSVTNSLRPLNVVDVLDAPIAMAVGRLTLQISTGAASNDVIPDLAILSAGNPGMVAFYRGRLPANEAQAFVIRAGPYSVGNSPSSIALGNFTLDGDLDAVIANQGSSTLQFFQGTDSGEFEPLDAMCERENGANLCTTMAGPRAVAVADIDGDGNDDVITANEDSGSITILLSRPDPRPATPTITPPLTATPTATFLPTFTRTPTSPPASTATPTSTAPTATPTAGMSCCVVRDGEQGCTDGPTMTGCADCIRSQDEACFASTGRFDQTCVEIARRECASQCHCPEVTATPTLTATATHTATPIPTRTATSTVPPSETPTTNPNTRPSRTPTGTRPTETITPTPTTTATVTSTATATTTSTRTPSVSPTNTSRCAGSTQPCVEGNSCAIDPEGNGPAGAAWWIIPALLLLAMRGSWVTSPLSSRADRGRNHRL